MDRKKILFVAEAATLAHVARPLVLSAALGREQFDLGFACDPRYQWLLPDFPGRYFPLPSVGSDHFLAALAQGKPLYDEATLDRYVRDDLELLDHVKPDAVIGDFRLSLSISARVAGIPYAAISNCYWSPYWRPPRYTVPNLPLTRIFPLPVAQILFQAARPIAFALHAQPLNRVRRRHGLSDLGSDLRRVYTDADHVLYADIPELFPGAKLPPHHQFIGPLIWSPPVAIPDWWEALSSERPVVYVTLGSSGQVRLLPEILWSLADLDITVIAATAGADVPSYIPDNARVARYLPGLEAARRAKLVICNGGSPSSQQALAAGVPIIGIASNLDQFLNMDTITRAGAGMTLRADRFDGLKLRKTVGTVLSIDSYSNAADRFARHLARSDVPGDFVRFLGGFLRR